MDRWIGVTSAKLQVVLRFVVMKKELSSWLWSTFQPLYMKKRNESCCEIPSYAAELSLIHSVAVLRWSGVVLFHLGRSLSRAAAPLHQKESEVLIFWRLIRIPSHWTYVDTLHLFSFNSPFCLSSDLSNQFNSALKKDSGQGIHPITAVLKIVICSTMKIVHFNLLPTQ